MLAAGHCAPTCYALWMIMGEALARKYQATGDRRYYVAPDLAMLAVDALGFRRGAGALKNLLADQDRKSTRLNSSHRCNSYAVFCLKKKQGRPVLDVSKGLDAVRKERIQWVVLTSF